MPTDFLGTHTFDIVSPLPPAECVERLSGLIERETLWTSRLGPDEISRPMIGLIEQWSLQVRKPKWCQHPFQLFLVAYLEADGPGCRPHVSLGLHPWVPIWMTLAGIMFSALALISFLFSKPEATLAVVLAGVFIWMAFRIGRYVARGEDEFLESTVTQAIQGRRVETGPESSRSVGLQK